MDLLLLTGKDKVNYMRSYKNVDRSEYMLTNIKKYLNRKGGIGPDIRYKLLPIVINTACQVKRVFRMVNTEVQDLIVLGWVVVDRITEEEMFDLKSKTFYTRVKLYVRARMVEECMRYGYAVRYPYNEKLNQTVNRRSVNIDTIDNSSASNTENYWVDRKSINTDLMSTVDLSTESFEDRSITAITVKRVVDSLKPEHKFLYEQYYVNGQTFKEIGELTNTSFQNVAKKHERLIKMLKERLETNE